MITRGKQSKTSSTWKPFATSTPLRIITDETKAEGLPPKQFAKGKDVKVLLLKKTLKTLNNGQSNQIPEQKSQIAKKIRRNRSSYYLIDDDSSSSSSEDESYLSNNGPKLIINLESNTNLKNNSKKRICVPSRNNINECKTDVSENGVTVKIPNKRRFPKKEIGINGKSSEKGKPGNSVILSPQKLDFEAKLPVRSRNSNCDYEDKDKENSLKEQKIISQYEGNKNCRRSEELKGETRDLNSCKSNNSTRSSVHDMSLGKEYGKSNQRHEVSIGSKDSIKSRGSKGSKVSIKSQNLSVSDVPHKNKRTKPLIDADQEEEIEKKRVKIEQKLTPDNKSPKNKKKSNLKIKRFRKDSSHQLFSESMHEELINSLDLTNAELDILDSNPKHVLRSPWKQTPKKSFPKRTKPKENIVKSCSDDLMEKTNKPIRQRQPPKEFWMPKNQCDFPNKETSVSKGKLENEPMKIDLNQGNLNKSLNIRNDNEKVDTVSLSKHPMFYTKKNFESKSKTKKLGFSKHFPNKAGDGAKKSENDEYQLEDESNKENRANTNKDNFTNFSDVFKQLSQLPTFEDYVDGVQTAQCWSLKNFKCGVLKISNQCQVSDKTAFKNSYFGGILIKGSLKMKIGSKELEINQGDMAFVPPLTEWCAIGTHESESLFYYWCGRFQT